MALSKTAKVTIGITSGAVLVGILWAVLSKKTVTPVPTTVIKPLTTPATASSSSSLLSSITGLFKSPAAPTVAASSADALAQQAFDSVTTVKQAQDLVTADTGGSLPSSSDPANSIGQLSTTAPSLF